MNRISYTVAEVAEALGCSEWQVRHLVATGKLAKVPLMGRRTLIGRAALIDTFGDDARAALDELDQNASAA